MFQSLTDLGVSVVRCNEIKGDSTYRVLFKSGSATSAGNAIGFLIFRASNGQRHLSLFVSGYGYGSARMAVTELTKGSYLSYEIDEENYAILVSITGTGGIDSSTNAFFWFGLSGISPTFELVE